MKMKNPRAVFIPLLERLMELGLTASDIGHLIGRSSNYTSVCMERSQTVCDLTVHACQQLIAGGEFRRGSDVNSTALLGVPKIGNKP